MRDLGRAGGPGGGVADAMPAVHVRRRGEDVAGCWGGLEVVSPSGEVFRVVWWGLVCVLLGGGRIKLSNGPFWKNAIGAKWKIYRIVPETWHLHGANANLRCLNNLTN